MTGTLYLVATPIGNLEDITLRALRVLREAAWIACEDTRQTRKLLDHFGIATKLVSYHEHNEAARAAELVGQLQAGVSGALVSDAGTPLISDPGYRLVAAAIASGITVVPIPGASAALAALAGSGLGTDAFTFRGFLPPRTAARRKTLEVAQGPGLHADLLRGSAPHSGGSGGHRSSVGISAGGGGSRAHQDARGVSARHGFRNPPPAGLAAVCQGRDTLLIGRASADDRPADLSEAEDQVRGLEQQGLARMEAVKRVAKALGIPKRELYRKFIS